MPGTWEAVNPRTSDLDLCSTRAVLERICDEDRCVPDAVAAVLPALEAAVELLVSRLERGGSVHAFGAGTSGRLALLDALELGPTFGLEDGVYVAHLAGGNASLERAEEAAEDDTDAGVADAAELGASDVALGVSASGRTPYVVGALHEAMRNGAASVLLSCSPLAPLGSEVDVHIAPQTGPEVLAGSTRMKAGTATKLVLNVLSTTAMIRTGRTYSNYMVRLEASNAKLRARALLILESATGTEPAEAGVLLELAGFDLPVAMVMALAARGPDEARAALLANGGSIRSAITELQRRT